MTTNRRPGPAGRGLRKSSSLVAAALALATVVVAEGVDAAAVVAPADATGALALPSPTNLASGEIRAAPPAAGVDTFETVIAEARRGVVQIDVEMPSGSRNGSGFIVSSDGIILTNQHVVAGARQASVRLASGDEYHEVSVLKVDARRDLAVLEVAGFGLPTLELGNSSDVRIGTDVIAIGSPLGLENTASTGIVSGRRKKPEGYRLLQISAPASRGSSGGPVLSRDGRVIGVATSQLQEGQNLNFAVPINYARGLLNRIDGSDPVAVLAPEDSSSTRTETTPLSSERPPVNRDLRFDLDAFDGYELEFEGRVGEDSWRRKRVTYRRINSVSGGAPRIERYAESETTERSGSFDTNQVVQRRRSRVIVDTGSLRPISAQGEVARVDAGDREVVEYDLRFDDWSVRGTVRDSTGSVREVDEELPAGIIPRSMRNLAFATLAADTLVGRSVELVTFDARTAGVVTDRYDIRDTTTVSVAGKSYGALRVSVASGLYNSTSLFRLDRPRMLLRTSAPGQERELELVEATVFPRESGGEGSPR